MVDVVEWRRVEVWITEFFTWPLLFYRARVLKILVKTIEARVLPNLLDDSGQVEWSLVYELG